MGISETSIRRPVFTSLVTMTIIVFGIFAYRLLPVAALPAVDFPTINISANLPGASPETMAASVASVIERELSTISGIRSITSGSTLGRTRITIQFDLERDIDGAALDVQAALTTANRRLPEEMTSPPSFRKVNPGDFPILFISLRSTTLPLSTVDEYAQIVLAQQISQLPGVAQVDVNGSQKFAVRVQVDPIAARAAEYFAGRNPPRHRPDQLQLAGRNAVRRQAERDAGCHRCHAQGRGIQARRGRLPQRHASQA